MIVGAVVFVQVSGKKRDQSSASLLKNASLIDPQRSEVEMFRENYSDDFVEVGGIGGRAGKEEWE